MGNFSFISDDSVPRLDWKKLPVRGLLIDLNERKLIKRLTSIAFRAIRIQTFSPDCIKRKRFQRRIFGSCSLEPKRFVLLRFVAAFIAFLSIEIERESFFNLFHARRRRKVGKGLGVFFFSLSFLAAMLQS
jgi:hypothetical protein